jgi:hypothetical protein
MRKEPYGVDSYVHAIKRGAKGLEIARDELDRRRFEKILFYLNDAYRSDFWEEDLGDLVPPQRPRHWPARAPIIRVVAWTLMPNHFHLLMQETEENGISRFMQSIGGSMTRHFNEKYEERGSLFSGSYRSRTIDTDRYLRWVFSYVLVKNVFEMHPKGFAYTLAHFDEAWEWALREYPHSSLREIKEEEGIVSDLTSFHNTFRSVQEFKSQSRAMLMSRVDTYPSFE